MQRPNYPKHILRDFGWCLKSDWGEYVRTFAVTAAIVWATIFATQAGPSEPTSSVLQSPAGIQQEYRNALWHWRWMLYACAILYLVGSWSSITKDAKRRKYDPALALKYTDMFFEDLAEERKKATEVLIRYHEGKTKRWEDVSDRCEIDPILDVLDDVGFLLQGGQISNWVTYQYFSYWVHLYYQAAEGYVQLKRIEDNTLWEHLPDLYSDMMEIQEHKNRRPRQELLWKHDELVQALKDEVSMICKKNRKNEAT